jgi:hypothetical protein
MEDQDSSSLHRIITSNPSYIFHNRGNVQMCKYNSIDSDKAMWEKHGFYIHLNGSKSNYNKVDYHTHGILHSRGHKDLIIIQPIDPELAKAIFIAIIEKIDNKEDIREGIKLDNVLGFINLLIVKGKEDNRLELQITNLSYNLFWNFF